METSEELIAQRLELIRDSIVTFKHVTDTHDNRLDRLEKDLADCRERITEISDFKIIANQQIGTLLKAAEVMSSDIRSVRNSVLAAILTATFVWIAGTVFTANHQNRQTAIVGEKVERPR